MESKERYWRNALVVLILIMGVTLFVQFKPMLTGLLGTFTVYVLVRRQMFHLTEKKKWNKTLVAVSFLLGIVLCVLIPTFFVVWLLLGRIEGIEIEPKAWLNAIENLMKLVQQKTGYDALNADNLHTATSFATTALQTIIGEIGSFVVNAVVLLFVLYFMLIGGRKMEKYIKEILPFNDGNKRSVLREIHLMVVSNAIGIPLLGVIQGVVAFVGYLIFGIPNALLFGLITCFATIIPLVGTSIVWVPLCLYFGFSGNWFACIGLALYSGLILTNIDNAVRFIMQKKIADTHPLITVFGVIIGLPIFGFWGVIFGPLLMSMFFLCIDIFKKEYLLGKNGRKEECVS